MIRSKLLSTCWMLYLLLGASVLFLTACFAVQHPDSTAPVKTNTVHMAHHAYTPAKIIVAKGQTVTWINDDWAPHTVTGNGFDSGKISARKSYRHVFTQPGIYAYHCTYHANMQGIVEVY